MRPRSTSTVARLRSVIPSAPQGRVSWSPSLTSCPEAEAATVWPPCASASDRASPRSSNVSDGPLKGTLVVELGNLIAAPYATMLLADLGARVIKVEPPDGDLSRRFGPFQNGESLFFMVVNRGKESVAIDTN